MVTTVAILTRQPTVAEGRNHGMGTESKCAELQPAQNRLSRTCPQPPCLCKGSSVARAHCGVHPAGAGATSPKLHHGSSVQRRRPAQDLDDAMGVLEMTEALSLQKVTSHDWHMQPCCALSGDGLPEGFGWISQRVHRHLKHGSG